MRGQGIAIDIQPVEVTKFFRRQGCARPEKWNPNVTEIHDRRPFKK